LLKPNPYKGRLVVVEGIDGSGKSTQIDLLTKWLRKQGKPVYFSEWNSSELVKSTTRLGKSEKMFTPTTFSLLQSTDFAHRWENKILPMLKAGVIVLADRFAFTAFARDVARGVDPAWVRELYSFAVMPNLALYFRVPLDVAVNRILSSRAKIKYYEAGMDLGLSTDKATSFKMFQQLVVEQYDKMVDEFGFKVIDGSQSVETQQKEVRAAVQSVLSGWEGMKIPSEPKTTKAASQMGGHHD
jgi:dTMP kinase